MFRTIMATGRLALLLGFLAAAVGFSYALATSTDSAESGVATRGTGVNPRLPLDFTNAFVPGSTDRDLGDAALGSEIKRFIQARGGIPVRRFTSDRTLLDDDGTVAFIGSTTLGEAMKALPSSAKPSLSTAVVFLNGILFGQIGGVGGTVADNTPLRFDVTVEDSRNKAPNKKNDTFRITLVDPNTFKFSQSLLSNGIQFRRYRDKLEVIAGNAPYTFSASNVTVTTAGVTKAFAKLEEIGLFLNKKTGRIVGRPLFEGTVSFLADCVDSKGAHALSRDKTGSGQRISFDIANNPRVASELFALKMQIKGDVKSGGGDTINYMGILDLENRRVSELNGLGVTLQIDEYTSPTVVLQGGKGTNKGTKPEMTVSLNPDGMLKIMIKNDNFGKEGSILTADELAANQKILPVMVTIEDPNSSAKPAYDSAELLRFTLKAKSSKFSLDYKFGPGNLGGGFIITSVQGKDDKASSVGDSWKVAFVSLPPNEKKLSQFPGIVNATVGIGTDFTDTIAVTPSGDKVKSTEKRSAAEAAVLKVAYDSKSGKGGVTTGLLPETSALPNTMTSIPTALNAKVKHSPFPFLIKLNDGTGKEVFGAEGSRRIVPKGNQWVSKDLSK